MRSRTVRSGLRFMIAGIACIVLATFFSAQMSRYLFMGMADEVRLTFLGFIVGWMLSGWGALVAVAGFVQATRRDDPVRVGPTFLLLISLIVLFFVLAYNSMTTPHRPQLQPGETIDI